MQLRSVPTSAIFPPPTILNFSLQTKKWSRLSFTFSLLYRFILIFRSSQLRSYDPEDKYIVFLGCHNDQHVLYLLFHVYSIGSRQNYRGVTYIYCIVIVTMNIYYPWSTQSGTFPKYALWKNSARIIVYMNQNLKTFPLRRNSKVWWEKIKLLLLFWEVWKISISIFLFYMNLLQELFVN